MVGTGKSIISLVEEAMTKRIGLKFSAMIFCAAAATCLAGQALADQTHVTVTVGASGDSAAIPLPITNSPIVMSCTQTVAGNVGTGQATITRSTTDGFPVWNAYDEGGIFTQGEKSGHIVYCDFYGHVDIQVASSTSVKVHNAAGSSQTVVIMFTY
jgi:hypothetical protein